MCGIAGFIHTEEVFREDDLQHVAESMASALAHRGPDDAGTWTDAEAGVALAHRRLSILDLSVEGRQPMASPSGRYIGVFNGEVYNFAKLRGVLERKGYAFRGHSDTEVLLAAIEEYGVRDAVTRANSMLALALWDCRERALFLVRDRMGKKPIYYGWAGSSFVFGSELKAVRQHPQFSNPIDRGALALYLRYGYVPAPHSIHEGIYKLPPGAILQVPARALARSRSHDDLHQRIEPYWSLRDVVKAGSARPFQGSDEEAVATLDALLRDAVAARMVADVPLGAFLSGGLDSSTVVALMQAQSSRPVQTFTIGSSGAAYDEAPEARAVARHLGTDHTELYVTPQDALDVIPDLPRLYDEPFSDASQIPTYLVSHLARQHVTVTLSGDGGDELFGGYSRHVWGDRIWRRAQYMPRPIRSLAARLLTRFSPGEWDRAFEYLHPLLPSAARQRRPGDYVHKAADMLSAHDPRSMYRRTVSRWPDPSAVVIGAPESPTMLTQAPNGESGLNGFGAFAHYMMYLDAVTYLPDDILVKVDRASMAASLEARSPLLDYRVAAFAWRLPLHLKIRDGQGKWILRQVLHRYVPQELVERPKAGFAVPIDSWLRGPLRAWAEELLSEERLRREGYFNPALIRQRWREHLSEERNWQESLWSVLMFQQWLCRFSPALAAA